MVARKLHTDVVPRGERGFSLLEVMIAATLLIVVFFGLAQIYTRGRTQIDYEEDRRKATAVAQARLDGIRRDYRYDDLLTLADTETTYVVDNRDFTALLEVQDAQPEPLATTLTVTVTWNARVAGNDVPRTLVCSTILGRGMAWED